MKRIRKIVGAMLALCLCLFLSVPTFAAGEEYTYTIRFFSGKQGTFSEGEMMVFTDLHYGDRVNFYRNAVTIANIISAGFVRVEEITATVSPTRRLRLSSQETEIM